LALHRALKVLPFRARLLKLKVGGTSSGSGASVFPATGKPSSRHIYNKKFKYFKYLSIKHGKNITESMEKIHK